MTSKSIQKMKDTGRLVLTKGQIFWHYCIILFLLIPPAMTTVYAFQYYVTNTYTGVRTIGEMATWTCWTILLAMVFYFIQKRRLRFKIITIKIDSPTFIQAAKQTAKDLDWEIIEQKSNMIVAKSKFNWRSWGELITIIKDKDRILFNSICDPDNRPSVASWGMNKVNLKTFEQNVKLNAPNSGIYAIGA